MDVLKNYNTLLKLNYADLTTLMQTNKEIAEFLDETFWKLKCDQDILSDIQTYDTQKPGSEIWSMNECRFKKTANQTWQQYYMHMCKPITVCVCCELMASTELIVHNSNKMMLNICRNSEIYVGLCELVHMSWFKLIQTDIIDVINDDYMGLYRVTNDKNFKLIQWNDKELSLNANIAINELLLNEHWCNSKFITTKIDELITIQQEYASY